MLDNFLKKDTLGKHISTEAVAVKKVFLEISQNSQENRGVCFSIRIDKELI